jgi:Cytochrome P450
LNGHFLDDRTEIFDYETKILVRELFRYARGGTEPLNPQPHVGRCSLNIMLTIAFGIRTDTLEHPIVRHALRLSREFMSVSCPNSHEPFQALFILTKASWPRNCSGPVSNLVDFVPFLQHLPNSLTNHAKKLHKDIVDTYGGMISEIEKRMNSGQDVPRCLVKTLVEAGDQDTLDHLDKVMICSAFVVGGVESVRDHQLPKLEVPERFPEYISILDRLYLAMVFCDHAVESRHSRKSPF